jgi:hypothetical protein
MNFSGMEFGGATQFAGGGFMTRYVLQAVLCALCKYGQPGIKVHFVAAAMPIQVQIKRYEIELKYLCGQNGFLLSLFSKLF